MVAQKGNVSTKVIGLLVSVFVVVKIECLSLQRRQALKQMGFVSGITAIPWNVFAEDEKRTSTLSSRLDTSILTIPPPSRNSELNGVDNLYFPSWMEGEWDLTQTLVGTQTPLGLKFIGGPSGSEEIALKSMKEQEAQLNKPVSLRVRFLNTKWGVAEDRLFNMEQRLNQFAGGNKKIVSTVEYANVGGSNRMSVMAMGGSQSDPLTTTVVYFRGPAAQKTFMTSHGSQFIGEPTQSNTWYGFELDRSIFALTNTNPVPPVTTDQEILWELQRVSPNQVKGRLRLAGYLNAQSDNLFFEAKNRAVSIADYTLELKRSN